LAFVVSHVEQCGPWTIVDGSLENDLDVALFFNVVMKSSDRGVRRISSMRLIPTENNLRLQESESNDDFDLKHGTETATPVEQPDLDIDETRKAGAISYVASLSRVFRPACHVLPRDLERFTFVDLGSGKGRALLLASDYPFKRIFGVELSEKLCQIARSNIAVYRSPKQKCADISVLHSDLVAFPFPEGDLVLYFYCSVVPALLRELVQRLERVVRGASRTVYFISCNPQIDLSVEFPFLRKYAVFDSTDMFAKVHIYTNAT
jgi:SAM-dependent methyltransferase